MPSYVVICGGEKSKIQNLADIIEMEGPQFLSFTPDRTTRWEAQRSDRFIEVIVWHNGDLASVNLRNGFDLSLGWSSAHCGVEFGEFLRLTLDEHGNGCVHRNKTGVYAVYSSYAANVNCHIVSDVSSICAWTAQGSKTLQLNRKFIATAIAIGWPMFDAALFDHVRVIKPNESVIFKGGRVCIGDDNGGDQWWSDDLRAEFEREPGAFWDARVAELLAVVGDFFERDGAPKLSFFSLSGGKDSRLLLAALLKYPRFREVLIRTNGSPYNGDVLAAVEICARYGLKHHVADTVFNEIDLGRAFSEHVFVTQGRVPPTALFGLARGSARGVMLFGHELGMRDPFSFQIHESSLEALFSAVCSEFSNFDRAGILSVDAHRSIKAHAFEDFRAIYNTTSRPENAPWRFYIENRILHYVAQVKAHGEQASAVPYPLMTDHFGSAFYVIGRQARLDERPHYEMMRRLEPWLVYECPLNSQRWPVSLRLKESEHSFALPYPSFSSKRAPSNGIYAAVETNRETYRDFVLSNLGKLDDIVDRKRVEAAFARPSWNQHELGSLLYLVAFLGSIGANWTTLSRRQEAVESPFPAVVRSTKPVKQHTSGDGPVAALYRDVVPEAIIGISRSDQAKIMLSIAYELQKGGKEAEAVELFLGAAALGHPQGHFHTARSYLNGTHLKQDYKLALRHFQTALAKGMQSAAASIGDMYLNGQGVSRDAGEAIRYYRLAERADPWTPLKLARAYEMVQRGEEANWHAAYHALLDAGLIHSNGYAAYVCWDMIMSGKVEGTAEQARSLLQEAARLGNKDAVKAVEASNAAGA